MLRIRQAARIVGWLSCLVLLCPVIGGAAEASGTKRVLLLRQTGLGNQGNARFDASFVEALRTADSAPIDVDAESIGPLDFPRAEQSLVDYLQSKYAERKIDVIVTVGSPALTFARQHRDIFGNPPIVAAVSPAAEIDGNDDITGLHAGPVVAMKGMIDLALALRPDTSCVFFVEGTRDNTGQLEAEVKRRWKEFNRGLNLVYLRDLPLTDLVSRLAAIPEHSIVLLARQTMRDRVQEVDQFEALAQIVAASRVPVFSAIEDFLGRGIVSGYMWSFETNGRRMAEMAKLIANGARARDIPVGRATYTNLLDWRQLQRWQIEESRIPPGSVVLFQTQSFFELHRRYVVGGLLVFIALLGLIVGLLVQRWRRQYAQEESRKSEERYRSIVDTQSELICRFLPDTTLTFVNDAYCRFWNKRRDELLGRKFIELVPPPARAEVLERIGRLGTGMDSHEHPVTLPDGTIAWQHWVYHAIVDENGEVAELQRVGRDITERKRAEEAIGQLEARNSAILRAIPDLMFVLQRDGTYVDYHARDPKLLFVPPDHFIGRTIREVMPPAVADKFMGGLERAWGGDDAVVVDYELPMGEPRYFEARLVYAGHDRVLSIVRDVTESKRALELNRDLAGRLLTAQEAERVRIARDLHDDACQEVAGVAVAISNLVHRSDIRDGAVRQALSSIHTRVAGIAESLRLLSHDLHPSVLQHIGLVAALEAHCAEVERHYEVQVSFTTEENVEPAAPTVALSLFRIAQEALRNAARHGHARHATVALARCGDALTLSVVDDGVGFDVAGARRNGGLGLVSIEERARLVKGQVTIRSQLHQGTTVDVSVPLTGAVDPHLTFN